MPLILPLPVLLLWYTHGVAPLYILPFDMIALDPSCTDTKLGAGDSVRVIGDPLLVTFMPTPIPMFIKLCPTVPKLSSVCSPSPSDNDGERDRGPKMPLIVFVVDVEDLVECVCTPVCVLLLSLLIMTAEMFPMRFECSCMDCAGEGELEPRLELELDDPLVLAF
jgi:hypothetical protein